MNNDRPKAPEPDFVTMREQMVTVQLQEREIIDDAVLDAMRTVPRHVFVPKRFQRYAYADIPLPILAGQTISQPYVVAYMLSALRLQPTDRALEVGTGSGYAAALLGAMVREVHTVERHKPLVTYARERIRLAGYADNVHVHQGNGTLGWPDNAPYDAILVSAGGPAVPKPLKEQLAPNGRLIIPVGPQQRQQILVRVVREEDGRFTQTELGPVSFVPLIGKAGWATEDCTYEELAHTSEVGIRVQAQTAENLFACAAKAMQSLTRATGGSSEDVSLHDVNVDAPDAESLMVDWLNELLFLHETSGHIFTDYKILAWQPTHLEAVLVGRKPEKKPTVHIKAVTYHQLEVTQTEESWTATIFFDI